MLAGRLRGRSRRVRLWRAVDVLALSAASATALLAGEASVVPIALTLWGLTVVFLAGARTILRLTERRGGRLGDLIPTLVVGAGATGDRIASRLLARPEYGLLPIGYLDADPIPDGEQHGHGVPILGGPDDLVEIARSTSTRHVILAFSSEQDQRMVELVKRCQDLGLAVSVLPRLHESVNEHATIYHIGGLPLLLLAPVDTNGWRFAAKHAIDRVAAVLALLLLAPLFVAIALTVRQSSPGAVIFRQRRVGRDGREFELFKFRTMVGHDTGGTFAPAGGTAPGGIEGADRRNRVGRWLRRTSLDELPQLVNVLRGEMSLIGPRPERPEFAAQFARHVRGYEDRHRVKPGITGWAQVSGLRGQTSIADRVEWDNHYIDNWSWRLELRTLALTLAELLRFRDDKPAASTPVAVAVVKPALKLVGPAALPDASDRWFCGYCGAVPAFVAAPAPGARVCEECRSGLLLEARSEMAPNPDEAFLVLDARLTVQALSIHAERMLAVSEPDATNRPVTELLVDANAEGSDDHSFANALARVTADGEESHRSIVRPRGTFGVRLRARISICGPPRATLIVLESAPTEPPLLRLAEPELVVASDAR